MSPTRFRLQEVLDRRQMSQGELSRLSGVSIATVGRLCRNETAQVSLDTLDRLARALGNGIKPGDLIASVPERTTSGATRRREK